MITHIVLFEPRQMDADRLRDTLQTVVSAVEACPSVQRFRIGRRIRHGRPGYEQGMRVDYQYALILEFDDVAGLTSYLAHPEHDRLGTLFAGGAAALAYDYELLRLNDTEQRAATQS